MVNHELENISHSNFYAVNILLNDCSYRQPHFHFDMEFVFVFDGNGYINVHEHQYEISSGYGMLLNSTQVHEIIGHPSLKLLIFQVSSNLFHHIFPSMENINFDNKPVKLSQDFQMVNYIHQAAMSYFDQSTNPLTTFGYLSLMLSNLMEKVPYQFLNSTEANHLLDNTERISRIAAYIQEHYLNNLHLDDVANQENLTSTYFSHYFKKNFGITFKEYVNNLRCEYAKHLLETSDESLLNIAYACGFSDTRSLNHSFMSNFQILPKDYRKFRTEQNRTVKPKFDDFSVDRQKFYESDEALAVLQAHLNL